MSAWACTIGSKQRIRARRATRISRKSGLLSSVVVIGGFSKESRQTKISWPQMKHGLNTDT